MKFLKTTLLFLLFILATYEEPVIRKTLAQDVASFPVDKVGCSGMVSYDSEYQFSTSIVNCGSFVYFTVLKGAPFETGTNCFLSTKAAIDAAGSAKCLFLSGKETHFSWETREVKPNHWAGLGKILNGSQEKEMFEVRFMRIPRPAERYVYCVGDLLFKKPLSGSGNMACINNRKVAFTFQSGFHPGDNIRCHLIAPIADESYGEGFLDCANGKKVKLTWDGSENNIGTGTIIDEFHTRYQFAYTFLDIPK